MNALIRAVMLGHTVLIVLLPIGIAAQQDEPSFIPTIASPHYPTAPTTADSGRSVIVPDVVVPVDGSTSDSTADESIDSEVIQCGPPDGFERLPLYAQEELKALWKNYVDGTPCDKELSTQEEILKVVSSFENDIAANQGRNSTGGSNNSVKLIEVPNDDKGFENDDVLNDRAIGALLRPDAVARKQTNFLRKSSSSFGAPTVDYEYFDQATFNDVATKQFDNSDAPFLRNAHGRVRSAFSRIWNDENIPSESLRTHKIQRLAVSLLTTPQLKEYNKWATKRRRVLRAREQELRHLSRDAKVALRKLSSDDDIDRNFPVAPRVKAELRDFVTDLNRRRSKLRLLVH